MSTAEASGVGGGRGHEPSIAYRPEVDGLRTLAIVAVVVFHVDPRLLPNGFLGVDVFFVISGFLITSILRRDLERGVFSMTRFWLRRARRILPALSCVLLVTAVAGYVFLAGPDRRLLGMQTASAMGFVSNLFLLWKAGDYWGPAAEDFPLLHTWSLSLEEQYYLLFPWVLALIWRRFGARVTAVFAGVLAASLALNLVGSRMGAAWAFYLLPSRGWQLLAGALVALAARPGGGQGRGARRGWLADAGLVLIAVSYVLPVPGPFSTVVRGALATGGAAAFIACGSGAGLGSRVLAWAPVVYIGKVSYSWYLWHWPVLVIGRAAGAPDDWLLAAGSLVLAVGSYHLVETPTRAIPDVGVLRRVVIPCLGVVPLLCVPLFTLKRVVLKVPQPTKWCDAELRPRGEKETGCVESGLVGNTREGLRLRDPLPGPLRALVLGDSHAKAWLPGIDAALRRLGWNYRAYPAAAASPFLVSESLPEARLFVGERWKGSARTQFDLERKEFLASNTAPIVVVAARWVNYSEWTKQEFRFGVEGLLKACPRSKLVFLGQPPELPFGASGFEAGKVDLGFLTRAKERAHSREARNRIHLWIRELAAEEPRIRFLDLSESFSSKEAIRWMVGSDLLYVDDDHLSVMGALSVTEGLANGLREAERR